MTAELVTSPLPGRPLTGELDPLLRAAAAAVSLPGGRPWRAYAVDRGVELRADVHRRLPFTGPGVREVRISAGAALLNMRLTVAAERFRAVTSLLPDPRRPGLLAVVRRGADADPTPAEHALYDAVPLVRRTGPAPRPDPVAPAARHLLRRAAEAEGVWLRSIVDPRDQERLAALPAVAERGHAGQLLVIGTNYDLPAAQLQAGQAMQRAMLTAAAVGLSASVVAGPAELQAAGTVPGCSGWACGTGLWPQVLLLVGHPVTAHHGAAR